MARLFQVKQLEVRKAALAAESEIYRQTLKLELQNIRLHSLQTKQRFSALASHPLVRVVSLAATLWSSRLRGGLSGARSPRWLRLATSAFIGWRTYRKLAPLLRGLFGRTPPTRDYAGRDERAPVPNN